MPHCYTRSIGDIMTYIIFEIKKEDTIKINNIIKDDLVSRQSITTRDANSLDIKGDATYLKIEGSIDGLKKAEEMAKELGFKKLADKKAKNINEKIEAQDDSAATGMGMIFD
jgi:hypothetical protein